MLKIYPPLVQAFAICFFTSFAVAQEIPLAQEVVDSWQYTLRKPDKGWQQPDFETSGWSRGQGGFGTLDTPGARVGTIWATNGIWLRKEFSLQEMPESPGLWVHHDEDCQIFLNGQQIASLPGFSTEYQLLPLDEEQAKNLKVGKNLLAVHCRQTTGGQFIDVHLVNGSDAPDLPIPERSTRPFESDLITRWGAEVSPANAWTEYPRPQMQRETWTNLNGLWDYAITSRDQTEAPKEWSDQILVPFPLESKLSGVQRLLDASEALWYRRTFDTSVSEGERLLLNFEAVDYSCQVYVNASLVAEHRGGHTPFSIDISEAVDEGSNELIVRVVDETEGWQLRGKQTLNARGIWYTQVSGIWQTVWLERVPKTYIRDVAIGTDAFNGAITIGRDVEGEAANIKITVRDGDQIVAQETSSAEEVRLAIPNAKLWSPDSPHLYEIDVALLDDQGNSLDEIQTYAGIRSVGKTKDADDHWRMTLNGEVLFHWGPLDQGWWPDGLLTPPSDEAMLFDIEWLKEAGFNMIRKHIKVEPRRYYYHCDRLGMMVWQDHVSGGRNPKWTRLQPDPMDATWPDDEHQQFMLELERMVDELQNHPSIVCWVPFNEAWGQHRTMEVGAWMVRRDPSRLVNIASGGNFWPVGDIVDAHSYPQPRFPFEQNKNGRFDDFIKVMGEFGGHGFVVPNHIWDEERRNWGYGGLPANKEEYKDRYLQSLKLLNSLRREGIAAGVYTQTTDVEGEVNGLMTYDRKVIKIPAKELAVLHEALFRE